MGVVSLLGSVLVLSVGWALSSPLDTQYWNAADIITRDVAIIGGGSSGTYAAVRLQDLNQSVVIVEQTHRLGGHTETFTDPVTGATIDIGVIFWENLDIAKNYLSRFNVNVTLAYGAGGPAPTYVDFRTGKIVPDVSFGDPTAALQAYSAQLAKYPYLDNGFDLPDPVPADLLLPLGDFVAKYNLSAAVSIIYDFNQGIGDPLSVLTLYHMKLFGSTVLRDLLQNGFLTSATRNNSELYVKVQAALSSTNALLLNSTVINASRSTGGDPVKLVVSTPLGLKLVVAKKILITIPPTLTNLASFDLDATEESIFAQFNATGYYVGVLRGGGIPDNTTVANFGVNTPFNIPPSPDFYTIAATGIPGLHLIEYGSVTQLPDQQVKNDIIATVQRMGTAGSFQTTTPEFAVYSSHTPYQFTVPASAIQSGFYRDLNALQAHRQTFYTGAAFHVHNSALLWQFTEALLPRIIA